MAFVELFKKEKHKMVLLNIEVCSQFKFIRKLDVVSISPVWCIVGSDHFRVE